jgi:indolepyruvate ferredoxin oxidoreductase
MERGLIDWYEKLIAEFLPRLCADNIEQVARIASLPMQIRGYGPVKEAAAEQVKVQVGNLRNGVGPRHPEVMIGDRADGL